MGERVDSVARPARCGPYDARHIARHSYPPLLRVPPPFPFVLLCPRSRPLVVLLGCTRLLLGVLPGRVVGEGGGRLTLARVPLSGIFLTGGRCMHSPSGCNSVVRAVHLYPFRTNGSPS